MDSKCENKTKNLSITFQWCMTLALLPGKYEVVVVLVKNTLAPSVISRRELIFSAAK